MTLACNTSIKVIVLDNRTAKVPCGSCTVCCQRDAIYLHPNLGDDPGFYHTENPHGRVMLAHKPNGDCIYLDRQKGCQIYEHRPAICRELDCRLILNFPRLKRKQLIREKLLSKKVVQAARECKKRGERHA